MSAGETMVHYIASCFRLILSLLSRQRLWATKEKIAMFPIVSLPEITTKRLDCSALLVSNVWRRDYSSSHNILLWADTLLAPQTMLAGYRGDDIYVRIGSSHLNIYKHLERSTLSNSISEGETTAHYVASCFRLILSLPLKLRLQANKETIYT